MSGYFKTSKPQGGFAGCLEDPEFDCFRLNPADIKYAKDKIGKGTYGTVYTVEFRGSFCAAKEFHPNFTIRGSKDKEKKKAIKFFQRCATELRHDNIVRLFGGYENKEVQPNTMVLIMEKMDCSLSSLLENSSEISNSTKLSILSDVCSGLKYMHRCTPPMVHLSLSSSSILLTAERKAKISDIGVARLVVQGSEIVMSPKAQPFKAPGLEILKDAKLWPTADVFSCGAIMLHTITQQQPEEVSSAKQAKQSGCGYSYESQVNQIAADPYFQQVTELVKSCLYHDPNSRPKIAFVSQVIEIMTKVPDVSSKTENLLVTSQAHKEVQQTDQVQPSTFGADLKSTNPDVSIENLVPALPYSFGKYGAKVVGFQNLGNTCFFNSMLQCIHQTVDLHYAIAKGTGKYTVENSIEGLLPVQVKKPSHGVTATLRSFFSSVNQQNMRISPHDLLRAIGTNNYRFGRGTQEDSHEVLRCLLSSLREEEISCIKQGIYSHYHVSQNFLRDKNLDGETKLSIKEYLSKVSKGICDVDCTVGVEIVTTTICHHCKTPLQLKEFCLDLALPMPSNSYQGYEGDSVVTSKQKFNMHLQKKGLHCHKPLPLSTKFKTDLENSLWAFTKLDVLDENNKFICHACSNAQNFQIVQRCVSKQILIHKLSPVLILQMKRFTIHTHSVTKDNQHVSFPRVLNMAPYCTTESLEDFGDSKGQILYGLYGVVVHSGSLHGGHYIACVRQRPLKESLSTHSTVVTAEHNIYDAKAAEEGQWYYTSDSHVSPTTFDQVKGCQAYLLFYEMLPGNEWLREVKRNRKASTCSDQVTEPTLDQILIREEDEYANQIKASIKDKITGMDKMKAKIEHRTKSFEVTMQSLKGYVKVIEETMQAVEEYKKDFNEISLAVDKYKESFEELSKNVEHLQTKHQQNTEQIVEDKDNQITKLATDLKSKEEETEGLKHNVDIKMTKIEELEKQIKMLVGNLAEQNVKIQKLEMTVEEMKDSKQAADVEHQQTLDQHKIEVAKIEEEKKKILDTIRAQDEKLCEMEDAIKQSDEIKQAITKENQQLIKDLEDSRTLKDISEKKTEELYATIEKQKAQLDQIIRVAADDLQSPGKSEQHKEEEQEDDSQQNNVKPQQKNEQEDNVEQDGDCKQQRDNEVKEDSKWEDDDDDDELQEHQHGIQQVEITQQQQDGKCQKDDKQEVSTQEDKNKQQKIIEEQQNGKHQDEVEREGDDNQKEDGEEGVDDKQKDNNRQQEQQKNGKHQDELEQQKEGDDQRGDGDQGENDKQKDNNRQQEQQKNGKHLEQQKEDDDQQGDGDQRENDKQKDNNGQQEQQQNGKHQDEVNQCEEENGKQQEGDSKEKGTDMQQRSDEQQQSDEHQKQDEQLLCSQSKVLSQKSDQTQVSDQRQEKNEKQQTNSKQPKKSEQQDNGERKQTDKSQENGEHQKDVKQQLNGSQQEADNLTEDNSKKKEQNEQNQHKKPLGDSQNKEENNQTMYHADRKYQDGSNCTKIKPVKPSNNAHNEKTTTGED